MSIPSSADANVTIHRPPVKAKATGQAHLPAAKPSAKSASTPKRPREEEPLAYSPPQPVVTDAQPLPDLTEDPASSFSMSAGANGAVHDPTSAVLNPSDSDFVELGFSDALDSIEGLAENGLVLKYLPNVASGIKDAQLVITDAKWVLQVKNAKGKWDNHAFSSSKIRQPYEAPKRISNYFVKDQSKKF
jgi:hypothetical protein